MKHFQSQKYSHTKLFQISNTSTVLCDHLYTVGDGMNQSEAVFEDFGIGSIKQTGYELIVDAMLAF